MSFNSCSPTMTSNASSPTAARVAAEAKAAYDSGIKAFKQGDYAAATRAFQRLVLLHPDHFHASYLLGTTATQAVRPENGLRHLARAACHGREDTGLYPLQFGRCLGMLGRFEEAELVFQSAQPLYPDNPQLPEYRRRMTESARSLTTTFGTEWGTVGTISETAARQGLTLGIFFVRSVIDLDHLTPVVWHWSTVKGQCAVVICVEPTIRPEDFRLRFLAALDRVEITGIRDILPVNKGEGSISGAFDPLLHLIRNVRGNARRTFVTADGATTWLFEQISRVCRDLGISFVSLPRGEQAKINRLILANDLSFKGLTHKKVRDIYDIYLFGNKEGATQVKSAISFSGPRIFRVVGSARYSNAWLSRMDDIEIPCPALPDDGELKIILFIPKPREAVWWEELARLIEMVGTAGEVTLVIQEHPRRAVVPDTQDQNNVVPLANGVTPTAPTLETLVQFTQHPNVHIVPGTYPGSGLVRYADVCICLATSMAIEAVRLNKPVLEASYIHANRSLVASKITETDMRCRDDLLLWIERFLKTPNRQALGEIFYTSGAREQMLAEIVDAAFEDVLEEYSSALNDASLRTAAMPRDEATSVPVIRS